MSETLKRIARRLTSWAWEEMLFDVARAEWKYGRYDNGAVKDWSEWNDVRDHLLEAGKLRQPHEIECADAVLKAREK